MNTSSGGTKRIYLRKRYVSVFFGSDRLVSTHTHTHAHTRTHTHSHTHYLPKNTVKVETMVRTSAPMDTRVILSWLSSISTLFIQGVMNRGLLVTGKAVGTRRYGL